MTETLTAGHQLRQIRLSRGWTQQEVADRSQGELLPQDVARLEGGKYHRPAMALVLAYAKVLGLTPNEVARMYGYWSDGTEPRNEPMQIAEARSLALRLPEGPIRDELLSWISFAVAHSLARAQRERVG